MSGTTHGDAGAGECSNSERERFTQLGDQLGIGEPGSAGFGDDDEISTRRHVAPVKAHEFPKTSFHSVAHHRVADTAAHAESKPRTPRGRLMERHDEKVRALPSFAAPLDTQELPPLAQAEVLSEARSPIPVHLGCGAPARFALTRRAHSLSPRGLRGYLDGQPLPALATPPFQHVLPSGCCHAGEEAVRPLPTQIARLVRALHPLVFPFREFRAGAALRQLQKRAADTSSADAHSHHSSRGKSNQ